MIDKVIDYLHDMLSDLRGESMAYISDNTKAIINSAMVGLEELKQYRTTNLTPEQVEELKASHKITESCCDAWRNKALSVMAERDAAVKNIENILFSWEMAETETCKSYCLNATEDCEYACTFLYRDGKTAMSKAELINLRDQFNMYGGDDGITAMARENERLRAERDAAIKDLKTINQCGYCKDNAECNSEKYKKVGWCIDWEWRGLEDNKNE